jgi:hypothetical protein
MARYREIDQTNLMLQIDLTPQLVPGTFEHAMAHIVETKIDTSSSLSISITTLPVRLPTPPKRC